MKQDFYITHKLTSQYSYDPSAKDSSDTIDAFNDLVNIKKSKRCKTLKIFHKDISDNVIVRSPSNNWHSVELTPIKNDLNYNSEINYHVAVLFKNEKNKPLDGVIFKPSFGQMVNVVINSGLTKIDPDFLVHFLANCSVPVKESISRYTPTDIP